jgi:hypothetical protein
MPYHPVFNSESFREHTMSDRFYLGIEARDPKFNPDETKTFLQQLNPEGVFELEN